MEGQAGDLVHVVIQCSNDRVILHVLLRCLVHHHLTHTHTSKAECTASKQPADLRLRASYLNGHGTLSQHALSIQDLDGGIGGACGNQLAIAAVRGNTTRALVRRHVAGLVLGRLRRHGLDVGVELQIDAHSRSHGVRAPDGILDSAVVVLHA